MPYIPMGLEQYAKFDPSISRGRIADYEHVPSNLTVMIHCLKNGDDEAAELVRACGDAAEVARLEELMRRTDHLMTMEERAA